MTPPQFVFTTASMSDTEARILQAKKAGSVTSPKKAKQSALNLAVAREKKRVVLNLGMQAYDKVVELGLAEYRKTQAGLEA